MRPFRSDQEAPPAKPGKKRVVVLGTGWAATAFLKHIDTSQFDVVCVSPRNYFLM
jgi:NADH:ubiquinone reductase (non-electrogenic)